MPLTVRFLRVVSAVRGRSGVTGGLTAVGTGGNVDVSASIELACVDRGYRGHDATEAGPGLQIGPQARRPRADQTRTPAAVHHRTRNRPLQDRRPSGPQLPARTPRRPHQRRHERRRLQPAPHLQVVEETLTPNHCRHIGCDNPVLNTQIGFLTTDQLGLEVSPVKHLPSPPPAGVSTLWSRRRMPCDARTDPLAH